MYFHKIVLIRELIIFKTTELQYISLIYWPYLPIERIFSNNSDQDIIFPTIISQSVYLFRHCDFLCATYFYVLYQPNLYQRLNDYFVPFLNKIGSFDGKKK